jgi:uncharacterized protein (TIGR00297 family)
MRSSSAGNPRSKHHGLGARAKPPTSCTRTGRRPRRPALRNAPLPLIVSHVSGFDASGFADHWAIGGLLTLVFALVARWLRGVTNGGALAGAAVCFVLYVAAGPGAFAALIAVFLLAWITTRIGYPRKQRLGIAEGREGRRASQVVANLGVATSCAAIYAVGPRHAIWLLAVASALSEAAADTVSSEVGQAFSERARLITNGRSVPAGTNGAVSLTGTLAGFTAAALVSLICFFTGLLSGRWLAVSVSAAILGMVTDSFLGAWLERRGLLNNDAVNFLSTLAAAGASAWFGRVWFG